LRGLAQRGPSSGALTSPPHPLCQLSDFSTGLSTLALSLHTFLVLVPMRPPRRRVAVVLIPLFWVVSALTACIGPLAVERNGVPFYGVAGKWCYIREEYAAWRFILLYDLVRNRLSPARWPALPTLTDPPSRSARSGP
jgi:hypothetical protein